MSVEQIIRETEDTLSRIKNRLYFLTEVETQFAEVTKGKTFQVKNDIVFRMLHDTWDMLVVDFASLAKGMLGSGGFFNKLKANTHQLKPLKAANVSPVKGGTICIGFVPTAEEIERKELEIQENFIENALKSHEETMFDLFPEARNRSPIKITPDDIDKLKLKFESLITDVVDDRNKHRAHKYERVKGKDQIDKLNFSTLSDRFQKILQIAK